MWPCVPNRVIHDQVCNARKGVGQNLMIMLIGFPCHLIDSITKELKNLGLMQSRGGSRGGGRGGGVLGVRVPPFWGPPNFIKRENNVARLGANGPHSST